MPDGRMGRVLIVVQNLPVPFDRRVWLEATTLAAAGYTVSVICPKLKGYDESYERLESVDIYRYPMPFDPSGRLGFAAETAWGFLRTLGKSFRVAWKGSFVPAAKGLHRQAQIGQRPDMSRHQGQGLVQTA